MSEDFLPYERLIMRLIIEALKDTCSDDFETARDGYAFLESDLVDTFCDIKKIDPDLLLEVADKPETLELINKHQLIFSKDV